MKILIVEDSPIESRMLEHFLAKQGFEDTTVCVDGVEALNYLMQNDDVELVFLDWNMPGISGLEVLSRIRQTPEIKKLKVVMVTGRAHTDDIRAALTLRVCDYIIKPVKEDTLSVKMAKIFPDLNKAA